MSLPQNVRFGLFDLDTHSGELRRERLKVRLPHQSFQILVALLERPGAVVTREELRQRLWPGETFVNFDSGLGSALRKLREALGDSAESPRFVETLPKHGFRFIAPVDGVDESAAERAVTSPPAATTGPAAPAAPATPARRWRSAAIVGVTLVPLAAAALLLLDVRWRDRLRNWVHPPQVRSLAVLPLENLTGDPALDGLIEAVSDSLTTELVRADLLEVASRTSAAQVGRAGVGVPEIARRLKVDAVVEGTVSRSGDRWLLNVQLIDGSSDRHIWAQRYERAQGEIVGLPRELAWEILRAIPPDLQPKNERGPARRRPATEEAYATYVLGRHFLTNQTPQNIAKAIDYFQRAIEEDPGYGPAYSGLSDAWRHDTIWGIRDGNLEKAEAAARKALELDGNLAEAHTSLGGVLWRHRKWEEAEAELRRALELEPNYAEGYRVYGTFLMMLRRTEESAAVLRQAHELDRLSLLISVDYASALIWAGRHDEALHELERAREVDPTYWRIYQTIAFVHADREDWTGAIAAMEQAPPRPPGQHAPWLGYYYAAAGRKAEALQVLKDIEASVDDDESLSWELGIVHLGLGDTQKALDLLETGFKDRPADRAFTAVLYDYLKDEPRYQAMLHEMGLSFSS